MKAVLFALLLLGVGPGVLAGYLYFRMEIYQNHRDELICNEFKIQLRGSETPMVFRYSHLAMICIALGTVLYVIGLALFFFIVPRGIIGFL